LREDFKRSRATAKGSAEVSGARAHSGATRVEVNGE
jgi:hypothetical protein